MNKTLRKNGNLLKTKNGFTLIELLVVIAIIALLLSIVTPALRKAKDAAHSVVCRSNLKQLGTGLQSYYVESKNKALVSDGGVEFWFMQIAPFLGDVYAQGSTGAAGITAHDQMRAVIPTVQCPGTREPVKEWNASQGFDGNGCPGTAKNQYRYHVERIEASYAINDWVGGWDWNFNPSKVGQAADGNLKKSYRQSGCMKSDVPAILDGMWVGVGPLNGTDPVPGKVDGYCWDRNNNITFDSGEWFQNEMERLYSNRHGKMTNLVYGDGHAEKIDLKDLWTLRWHRQYVPNYNVSIP